MTQRRAFTLVELIIVVLILSILAATAAPLFLSNMAQAQDRGMRETLAVMREAMEKWHAQRGSYPNSQPQYIEFLAVSFRRNELPPCTVGNGLPQGVEVVDEGKPLAGTGNTDSNGKPMWKVDTTTGEVIINYHAPSYDGSYYDEW